MRTTRAIIIGLVLATLVVGGYWYFRVRPRLRALSSEFDLPKASRAQTFEIHASADGDFDMTADLPGDPIGIAVNGAELLIANRMEPWGFLRVHRKDLENFEIRKMPVIETNYGQRMSFHSVTWNGEDYVALTAESWFRKGEGTVFTIHDPDTLAVKTYYPAPNLLGCVAWDGNSYWGATRRNTEDSGEPAILYHFNRNFEQIGRYDPPDKGCQGMTWDGSYLWFVDIFSDKIHMLDVAGETPHTLQTFTSPYNYLSGIAYDGQDIWISEYDNKQLHRLRPTLRTQSRNVADSVVPAPPQPEVAQVSESKTTDLYTNSFPDTGSEEMDILELKIDARGGAIYASWRLHFGEDLFANNEPAEGSDVSMPLFVRYTVSTEGGSLATPLEMERDATPGENSSRDELLALNLSTGTYSVHIFLHAQYVDKNGTNRILNSTGNALSVEIE